MWDSTDALRPAIKDEPAAQGQGGNKAEGSRYGLSENIGDANAPDADKLMAEHGRAVTAMNAIFELFPADLGPDPNTPPGRGRGAATN